MLHCGLRRSSRLNAESNQQAHIPHTSRDIEKGEVSATTTQNTQKATTQPQRTWALAYSNELQSAREFSLERLKYRKLSLLQLRVGLAFEGEGAAAAAAAANFRVILK